MLSAVTPGAGPLAVSVFPPPDVVALDESSSPDAHPANANAATIATHAIIQRRTKIPPRSKPADRRDRSHASGPKEIAY